MSRVSGFVFVIGLGPVLHFGETVLRAHKNGGGHPDLCEEVLNDGFIRAAGKVADKLPDNDVSLVVVFEFGTDPAAWFVVASPTL